MPQDNRRFNTGRLVLLAVSLLAAAAGLGAARLAVWHLPSSLSANPQKGLAQELAQMLSQGPASASVEAPVAQQPAAQLTTYNLPQATVRVVAFSQTVTVSVGVADELEPISVFGSHESGPVADSLINGGFFDPQNGKTTSHLVVKGEVVGDPADNERLVGNSDLQQYLPQILNRSEFRAYRCDRELSDPVPLSYDITFHDAVVPEGCEIESAVGAGPQLLPEDTSELEAFTDYENGELVRDAIGSLTPNARSAVGLDSEGAVYFIMVEKTADLPGLTLAEVAEFADSLGIVKLLNLDGGSSSSLMVAGQTFYGRSDANGNPIERPVKSVIFAQ